MIHMRRTGSIIWPQIGAWIEYGPGGLLYEGPKHYGTYAVHVLQFQNNVHTIAMMAVGRACEYRPGFQSRRPQLPE